MSTSGTLAELDDASKIRCAGRDLLSLALFDSRNRLLQLLALHESPTALQHSARAAWFQEYWITRHVQRQRGQACDPSSPRLPGVQVLADAWASGRETAPAADLRAYLQETLETTLDLLATSEESDAGLYFFRLALQHEDRICENLTLALGLGIAAARPQRPPLWLPAQRWQLGSTPGGLVPWVERWAHEVAVPEFEIDAQAVNWSQFVEFAEDGGYDQRELWCDVGWAWLQMQADHGQPRRAPRDVEQLRGGVLVQRRQADKLALHKVAAGQPVTQVSRHEAQAWCTWAGRRLPTEPEWELAACSAASRGFVWGDVLEWVAGSARAWPGAGPVPPGSLEAGLGKSLEGLQLPAVAAGFDDRQAAAASGVLRGATFAARLRWRHPKARRFARADDDSGPIGFRSCAI